MQRPLSLTDEPRRLLRVTTAGADEAIARLSASHGPGGVVGRVPLGAEIPWLLADLREGLWADELAAGVGAVVGGGTVLLVHDAPPRTPFEHRLLRSLDHVGAPVSTQRTPPSDARFATVDQQRAFADALRSLRRRRPVVLLADRGRGKSTLLGLLGAEAPLPVRVTAPEPASAASLLRAIGEVPATFVPPDAVEEALGDDAWWLVDEAAALPPALVLRIAERARRAILATTVHGYEGTGRHFELHVLPRLRRPTVLRLGTPARYPADDPVERWLHDLFLLDAEPDEGGGGLVAIREARLDDERELRAVFGLLVRAHYRTRPSDLVRLVDGDQRTLVATSGDAVIGAIVVADEGGWDADRAERVARGEERPRGELIPEVLSAHLAHPELAALRARRVVRVAVREDRRREGVGRALLAEVERGAELCGASFAADPDVLRFWTGAGHRLVRLGAGPSTLRPSMLVLRAGPDVDALWRRCGRDLPHALRERPVEPALAVAALRATPREPPRIDDADLAELRACARGPRHWEWSARALWELVSAEAASLPDDEAELLVARVLLGWSWDRLAARAGLPHRTEAVRAARSALASLLGSGDTR
ncbi:MAG: tRNA(Met) cytidine acetyltransferase [Alphaproteobacteria bacterium]|nr:tRNA(Met) cytidine acetyltransferase [Alphaproteobacteria bacterium]MCB9699960.1 tRNA(Met) cytidine acetyltransferase [Alphaproteobacteria bacterium]